VSRQVHGVDGRKPTVPLPDWAPYRPDDVCLRHFTTSRPGGAIVRLFAANTRSRTLAVTLRLPRTLVTAIAVKRPFPLMI
jgi:hypothetical protein